MPHIIVDVDQDYDYVSGVSVWQNRIFNSEAEAQQAIDEQKSKFEDSLNNREKYLNEVISKITLPDWHADPENYKRVGERLFMGDNYRNHPMIDWPEMVRRMLINGYRPDLGFPYEIPQLERTNYNLFILELPT